MKAYDSLIILKANQSEEDIEAQVATIESWITGSEGAILNRNIWGVRELATPINKQTKGCYVLIQFDGTPKTVAELRRKIQVTETILRDLTVTLDSVEGSKKPAEVTSN